jgi:4-hydroxybenzoate polyprenyltransferase
VAFLSGLPFVYGGLLSSSWRWSLIPFVFAFLVHFAREILKSIEDREGDIQNGVRTVAALASTEILLRVVTGLFLLVILLSFIPYFLHWYNGIYMIVLAAGVILPQLEIILILRKREWQKRFSLIHKLLKIEMLGGMIAILLAR